MKKYIKIIPIFLLILIFSVGCSTTNNGTDEKIITGTVEAQEIDVRNKIPGHILTLKVEEGQEIKKGDLLYTIDPKDIEVKKLQAEAQLEAAQAQLNKALSGARKQEIAQIQAVLAKAQAKEELLQKKYNRLYPLYEAGALPKDQLDEVETELTASKMDVKAAQEKLDLALEGARYEDIKAAQAQVEGANAILQEVNLHLTDTKVFAPISGNVSLVIAKEGELIGTGTPVITITDYKDCWVEANVDETEVVKLKVGQQAKIFSKAYPEEPFMGEIISINKNPDFAIKKSTNELNEKDTITYAVKIKILEDERVLYPGMLVDISFVNEGQ